MCRFSVTSRQLKLELYTSEAARSHGCEHGALHILVRDQAGEQLLLRRRHLFARNHEEERQSHECSHGIDAGCDDKGLPIVIGIHEIASKDCRSRPRHAADALGSIPPPVLGGGHKIHENRLVDRIDRVGQGPSDHKDKQDSWKPPQVGQEKEADDPRRAEEQTCHDSAHLRSCLFTKPGEEAKGQAVDSKEQLDLSRTQPIILLEEEGKEFHGHARSNCGDDIQAADQPRHHASILQLAVVTRPLCPLLLVLGVLQIEEEEVGRNHA
mmetsp:Transcript_44087/g.102993  ORF Transcript_44087/g.102993 Transcript_44087/m.102993 type:complete len:268 (-) Transcript_44087:598-1401(-)